MAELLRIWWRHKEKFCTVEVVRVERPTDAQEAILRFGSPFYELPCLTTVEGGRYTLSDEAAVGVFAEGDGEYVVTDPATGEWTVLPAPAVERPEIPLLGAPAGVWGQ